MSWKFKLKSLISTVASSMLCSDGSPERDAVKSDSRCESILQNLRKGSLEVLFKY